MEFGKVKKVMAVAMACLCVAGAFGASGRVVRAKEALPIDTRISKSELTMYPNVVKQLKVENAAGKVKWSSANSKIVSILGSRGKNQQTVTIRTKNRTGTCKVKAKVEGKTYTCKVTVKKDSNISRVKLLRVRKTSKAVQVKVRIYNRSGKKAWYGPSYSVEKFVDGAWKKVAPPDDVAFPAYVINVPARGKMDREYMLNIDGSAKDFTKGVYRLQLNVTGLKYKYALFTL